MFFTKAFFGLWVISFILFQGLVVSLLSTNERPTEVLGQEFVHSGGEISYAGFYVVNMNGENYRQNFVPWIVALIKILLLSAIPPLCFCVTFWAGGRIAVRIDRKSPSGVPAKA
jgi:hypothetical protein